MCDALLITIPCLSGMPTSQMRLVCNGMQLVTGTVQDYGIKKGKNDIRYLVSNIFIWQLHFSASIEGIVAQSCNPPSLKSGSGEQVSIPGRAISAS